ncbi:MAG: tRNA (adenosine(37)-N6)-threonylcarbamoyltransferase complex dimerization subunit type 1 TsaB [Actinomycetota bacterium]|nr:tRNA (adenosine(37)-N6)-threonylcarbamoyltransferase complex dimerization subunit type 1 TsaB [Actinomycetota bacterium]
MNVLGLDTSTAASSACVLLSDGRAFEVVPGPEELGGPPAHARDLLPRVDEVMGAAGADYGDLDAIAVGIGPGSFTGLRVGVATARALAHAHGLELRPVSSLAALAAGIDAPLRLALIDAKRGELFAALHEGDAELWEPFAATPEAVAARAEDAGLSPLAAGDGAVRFRSVLEPAGVRVAPDGSQANAVRALHVCRLAAVVPPQGPEGVVPNYLRAPDATPRQP